MTKSYSKNRAGLTLLELVMVVSILAILTALVVPGMSDQTEETRKTVARATMQEIRDVIANRYIQDLPTSMTVPLLPEGNALDTTRLSATMQAVSTTTNALPQMHFLFVNPLQYDSSSVTPYVSVKDYDPQARIGWNGPYLMTKSTTYPNPANVRYSKDPNNTQTWAQYGFTTTHGQPGDFCVMDPWGSPYVIVVQQTPHGSTTVFTANVVSAGTDRTLQTTTNGTVSTGDDLVLAIKAWK